MSREYTLGPVTEAEKAKSERDFYLGCLMTIGTATNRRFNKMRPKKILDEVHEAAKTAIREGRL